MSHDLCGAWRLIRRNPFFAAVAIATLSVAIGANTVVFTVINALLLKPLPAAAPHEVVRIKAGESLMSWPNFVDFRRQNLALRDLAAHQIVSAGLIAGDRPVRLTGEATSANFLSLLGTPALVGRIFHEQERRTDVVVLAHHLWRHRFAADPGVVGRTINIGGRLYEVIGVMPRAFRGVQPPGLSPDFWIPVDEVTHAATLSDRAAPQFEVIGRLRPTMGAGEAAAALRAAAVRIRQEFPALPSRFGAVSVLSVQGFGAYAGMAGPMLPVFAFVGFLTIVAGLVLLIACANLTGLLVGQAVARRREIAVRIAVGAKPHRLVRQLLTESLVLALLGGAGGLVLAIWSSQGLAMLTARLPIAVELDVAPDYRVYVFAMALAVATAVIFGLMPARQAARVDVATGLRAGASGPTARHRVRRILVSGQVAACTALLLWCGLFAGSLARLTEVDPGFNPSGVLLASVEVDRQRSPASNDELIVALQQRIAALPGVVATGVASVVPLTLRGREEFSVSIAGDPSTRLRVQANRVTPGWFATLQIPLIAGRDFSWNDRAGSRPVVIVNETMARLVPHATALGAQVVYDGTPHEVIGVVRDSKYLTLGERSQPTVYQPFRQAPLWWMTLHVRAADPGAATREILAEMQRLAPDIPVDVERMSDAVGAAILPARVGIVATGALGTIAVLLALLGVYALVANAVAERGKELGIRRAVGAATMDIWRLVLGSTARTAAAGVLLGALAGSGGALLLGGFIFGISPLDPLTLGIVAALVMISALAASIGPAVRATRIDPLSALRNE